MVNGIKSSGHTGQLEDLWSLIKKIPKGKVISYGDLGAALSPPVSGFLVGKWIARVPDGVPWWRVVSKSGDLSIAKRDPKLMILQKKLLESEEIFLTPETRVPKQYFFSMFSFESTGVLEL